MRTKTPTKAKMRERQKRLNREFAWSADNVAKIVRLNDRLWSLMQEADRRGKLICADIQKLIDEGKDYYDRDFHVEVCINYGGDLPEGADEGVLRDSVKAGFGVNGFDLMDKDSDGVPLNWNKVLFDRPELDGHIICYMMHWYFCHGLYSLQDAVFMDPDKFYIYTKIYN